jgi:hypothetical protein
MTGDSLSTLRDTFGFRVIFKIGPTRLLRAITVVAVLGAFVGWLGHWGWNVAAIGQDSWNYLGAGERLNAGHSIYSLAAGDRPIEIVAPSTVALVSPPLIAVLWRPLALLPDWFAMWAWWAAGAAAMLATTLWIVLKGRWQVVVMVFALATIIGECAVSGNLNSFLAPALALSWWATQAGRPRVAGWLTALGAVLKIGPAAILLWLAVRREGQAVVAFAIGAVGLAAISLLGAGIQQHLDFLSVARGSADVAGWGASLPGLLRQLNAPQLVLELCIPAVWLVGAALIWSLRRRPALSFVVAVVLVIWGTPVVHMTAVALLLATAAPLTPAPGWLGRRPARPAPQAV